MGSVFFFFFFHMLLNNLLSRAISLDVYQISSSSLYCNIHIKTSCLDKMWEKISVNKKF